MCVDIKGYTRQDVRRGPAPILIIRTSPLAEETNLLAALTFAFGSSRFNWSTVRKSASPTDLASSVEKLLRFRSSLSTRPFVNAMVPIKTNSCSRRFSLTTHIAVCVSLPGMSR